MFRFNHWIFHLLAIFLFGCQPAMDHQPKLIENGPSPFFQDGAAARPIVPHTISLEAHLNTTDEPPVVSLVTMRAGQTLYNRSCSVCHGLSGEGNGIVTLHGGLAPPAFETNLPDFQIVSIINNGKNTMKSMSAQLSRNEQWQIAYYVQALALSQKAHFKDLSIELKRIVVEKLGPK
jgi:mono/diheme cytochrome c family protein